ncbi:mpv17-like protein 2 [Uranotaenia lowii]|uniref:mpv17-like protein 2 n=1 Tax=Uranotaenia lowii TaxID=190385 RepID=UPI0024799E17|nr:mpv17-like protein 2 [Uranotaenia lowii]XP_055597670.1 mpv17-like protein 2 [Uranotaenia lowii]XP_055597759.1 mpv17-like protein 2 [Uranotaenia lowii]XP_055597760.1 mpv17-like protein 2 [Uranotaenia lowii]XP_055597761.1 mpv17-like protein 2 [Uranotaenia lowii]XP_055597762.1 mpv17-like protein 2 [Uranotaenia lowii]
MSKLLRFAVLRVNGNSFNRTLSSKATPVQLDPPSTATKRIWQLLFGKYLLVTNTISSGLLMAVGDIAAQEIEQRRHGTEDQPYNWVRLGQMTLIGFAQGPMHHFLYKWMDRFLPKSDTRTVFKKIGIDQFVYSPIFIVSYLYSAGLLEGNSIQECTDELTDKFSTIYTADWMVWPPTQFINFYLISPKYRVLYINAITTLYNVFICYVKHNDDLRIAPTLGKKQ